MGKKAKEMSVNLSTYFTDTRKVYSYILLFVLNISFVVENNLIFEGEVTELIENTKKETDQKEKKLLFLSLDLPTPIYSSKHKSDLKRHNLFRFNSICLDVITPPPEMS